jgi:hypothetical protein
MKISMRGWSRDMGSNVLIEQSLSELTVNEDGTAYRSGPPTLYKHWRAVLVGWHQALRHNGNYRMDLELSHSDIVQLFKAAFGSEITPAVLSRCGFKLSPDLDKAALARVKLSDLTLADLAAIMKPVTEETKVDGD